MQISTENPEVEKGLNLLSINCVNTFAETPDKVAGQENATESAKAAQRAAALKLKLRNQAKKLGLIQDRMCGALMCRALFQR